MNVPVDQLFLVLYKELYYRHIYTRLQPTLDVRIESFNNYCALFDILFTESPVDIELPSQWLWDIVDEYIYQFESFNRFQTRLKNQADIDRLAKESDIWSPQEVLNTLKIMVRKSKINEQLDASKAGSDPLYVSSHSYASHAPQLPFC